MSLEQMFLESALKMDQEPGTFPRIKARNMRQVLAPYVVWLQAESERGTDTNELLNVVVASVTLMLETAATALAADGQEEALLAALVQSVADDRPADGRYLR